MPHPLSRRSFLVAGGAAALAACSSGKKTASTPPPADLVLVSFSDSGALVPGSPQRLPLGLADKEGVVVTQPPTPTIDFDVRLDGQPIGAPITTASHQQGIARPYWPLVFTPPKAGTYTIAATVNGTAIETHVDIPATTQVVGPGQKMIPVDTPTTSDPHGVELVCTRTPPCPFHDVSLREALAAGTPVALLIATPKFCQTFICGSVMEVFVAAKDQFPQIKLLHAEVYPSEADAQAGHQVVTEAVKAYGLSFEPVLYLAGADGTITKRIDTIFDGVELHDAFAQLAG